MTDSAATRDRKSHPRTLRQLRVLLISVAIVVAYGELGTGRFPFAVSWAAGIPVWMKVASGCSLYVVSAYVLTDMHRGVLLGRQVMGGHWLVVAVMVGIAFALSMADHPAIFIAVSLGIYPLDRLCRAVVLRARETAH